MNITITAKNNERVKRVCKLMSNSSFRTAENCYPVEGLRLCVDAVKSGKNFEDLYVTNQFANDHFEECEELKKASDNVFFVSTDVMKKMADTISPQGVIGVVSNNQSKVELSKDGKYLALVNVQDPSNVGAAARTAEALGLDGIISCGGCDVFSPKSLRASMGAFFRMNVKTYKTTNEMFDDFKSLNIESFASTPRATARPISSVQFNKGSAVLIGNEANGLDDDTINGCDCMITIPMSGRAESLNASAAAAIICFCMTTGGGAVD